jgi:hypothetical protein
MSQQDDAQEFDMNYADDPCDDITLLEEWQLWLLTTESSTQTVADKS